MASQIREAFTKVAGHVNFDRALAKRLSGFQTGFVAKNEEHMAFFGGNLTGAHIVRFTSQDRDKFFIDIVGIDELELEDAISEVKAIDPDWNVCKDAYNQTCIWLIHGFLTSNLPENIKHQAAIDAALCLHYRFITSILYNSFKKHLAPLDLATSTYAQLSKKFALKRYGSWYATLEARSEALTGKDSTHFKTFIDYNDDEMVIRAINDSQNRIRDMIKNIYGTMVKIKLQGEKVRTTSMLVEHDGEQILKDKTKRLVIYTRYMHSIVSDEHSFVKQEILEVIEKLVHTAPPKLVLQTLQWMSVNYRHVGSKVVEELIDKTIVHSFSHLAENRNVVRQTNDLVGLLTTLKGIYTSSKSTEPTLMEIRELAEKIIKKATTTKNNSAVASVRTAVLLYIITRAFTMSHYGGSQ